VRSHQTPTGLFDDRICDSPEARPLFVVPSENKHHPLERTSLVLTTTKVRGTCVLTKPTGLFDDRICDSPEARPLFVVPSENKHHALTWLERTSLVLTTTKVRGTCVLARAARDLAT